MLAIQDLYSPSFSHCYGCGTRNPSGAKIRSYLEGDRVVARHMPSDEYTGGVPDHVYGGHIASVLDCHGAASAAALARASRHNDAGALPRFVTGTLSVRFVAPTPMGVELSLMGRLDSLERRKAVVELELAANGVVCATATMVAIELRGQDAGSDRNE